jgi:ubiquinone/menaquinone biosynthesis C-methylase UbiE
MRIELGGGHKPVPGFTNIDLLTGFDLNVQTIPVQDDTVTHLISSHFLEHVSNLPFVLQEITRVCQIGADIDLTVPWWASPMANCFDHKHVIPPEQVDHWVARNAHMRLFWYGRTVGKFLMRRDTDEVRFASSQYKDLLTLPFLEGSTAKAIKLMPHLFSEVVYRLTVVKNGSDDV